jgi:putative phosphoesterase
LVSNRHHHEPPALKVCIVSDSHDRAPMLATAVRDAQAAGAAAVIHCGDVIGTNTLRPLVELGLPLHVVHGNNIGDPVSLLKLCANSRGLFVYHGQDATLTLSGRRIFVTHYPHYGRGAACTGDFDLVCCGHDHIASVVRQSNIKGGGTWLVNPGTVAGLGAPATWMLADLEGLTFEVRELKA